MAPTEIIIQMGMTAFSICMTAAIGVAVKKISDRNRLRDRKADKQEKETDAVKDGIRAILRDRIIQADVQYTRVGFVTAEQKENIYLMYEAYHTLGGNGVVTTAYKHIMDIPFVGESNDQNDYHPL